MSDKKQTLHTEIMALCDYALIAQNNKPSIIGIFTELGVQQFPGGMFQAVLFATISGSVNRSYKLKFSVKNEKGKEPFAPLDFETQVGSNGKANINLSISNFVFPEPGEYVFSIHEGDTLVGSTNLSVFQANQNSSSYEYKPTN